MGESVIPAAEFESAVNAVNNILGKPVEEIEITDILPPLNDITDSNKVFKGKLCVPVRAPHRRAVAAAAAVLFCSPALLNEDCVCSHL